MPNKTLSDLSEQMRAIDITMLFTKGEDSSMAGRPMSNNGEVDYDGDSYYFTWGQSRMVGEIERDPRVSLSFRGSRHFLVAVQGMAELVRDKAQFQAHWSKDLDHWFKDGIDTPGIVMIKVVATRLHYWDGEEDGEIVL